MVLGMGIWENVLSFLVTDDFQMPCFAPGGLFELDLLEFPDGWVFRLCTGVRASGRDLWSDPCAAVWGYRELVEDPTHAAALEDREEHALGVFERRRAEAGRFDG